VPRPRVVRIAEDPRAAAREAARTLRAGGVVVFPTDTVYGVGADAFDRAATARVFEVKRRPRSLALPVLVARPRQAWALAAEVPEAAAELVAAFWPGALTLVLPQAEGLDWDLGETRGRVAVRMPAHDWLLEVILDVGPLAATSANVSGRPTPSRVEEIAAELGDGVSLYLDGGPAPGDVPSTIVDVSGPRPKVLREGAIPAAEVRRALGAGR
jgi:L-threonylcarbamoyladenylate synthase